MEHNETQKDDLPVIQFSALAAQSDIPAWAGTTAADLQALMDAIPTLYERIERPKKHGKGVRVVYALPRAQPIPRQLRAIQRAIARSIVVAHTFPPCVYGVSDHPRRQSGNRRSTVNNARQHLGRKLVLRCDLVDFFDQVRLPQVREVFIVLGASGTAVDCLTHLCTLDDRIPQGASSSSAIANVAARKLDDDLTRLATRIGCVYTRYVDDLVFSGEWEVGAAEVAALVISNGFTLNLDKTRLQRRGRSQYVTGLNVSDPSRTHIPTAFKRRLRSQLRLAAKLGFEPGTREQLEGMIAYVRAADHGVERADRAAGGQVPTFGDRMLELFQKAEAGGADSQGKVSVSV